MTFTYVPNSNVAAPLFGFEYGTSVGFDNDGKLFTYAYYDDSTFVPQQQPVTGHFAYYQWFICWQYLTGYYYQSVGWAMTLPPQNPTCEPVEIFREYPGYTAKQTELP